MRLPYRAGRLFALPLGDGRFVEAKIVATGHRWVEIAVGEIRLRVWDEALVLRRWRAPCHPEVRVEGEPREKTEAPQTIVGPAHAERIVATAFGLANLLLPPLRVHARNGVSDFVPALPAIRTNEELAAMPDDTETLHVTGPQVHLDTRALQRFTRLTALRLVRIATPIDLRALRSLPLRTLSLESLRDVRNIAALHDWESLVQLELFGFWQYELRELMPITELPRLARAEIDAGGRRKNLELYARARWAYPWPFEPALI